MKSKLTLEIEQKLISKYKGTSFRYSLEVSIGQGIADFVCAQYNHSWGHPHIIVYEIKISLADFKSESGHNFLGDENYYVMPRELFEEILKKDPRLLGHDVGVYVYDKGRLYLKREQSPSYFNLRDRPRIEERFLILDRILMNWINGNMSSSSGLKDKYDALKKTYNIVNKYFVRRSGEVDDDVKKMLEDISRNLGEVDEEIKDVTSKDLGVPKEL